MRFKLTNDGLFMLITALSILLIGLQDKLLVYIHPRYVVFTIVLCLAAVIVVLLSAFFYKKNIHAHRHSLISLVPLVVLVSAILLLPPKTLTSSTVSQRFNTSQSVQQTEIEFTGSTLGLSVSDWFQVLSVYEDPNYYSRKQAKITGFIYDAGLGENTIWVSRFVLTCCAVDARPVGVPVYIENWANQYNEDEWVTVEGEFKLIETREGNKIVLVPTSIEQIEEPKDPYEVW